MNMNEVKKPKKPLIYYYAVVVFVLILFNSIALQWSLSAVSGRWITAPLWR